MLLFKKLFLTTGHCLNRATGESGISGQKTGCPFITLGNHVENIGT
jgi:hypothetical protein